MGFCILLPGPTTTPSLNVCGVNISQTDGGVGPRRGEGIGLAQSHHPSETVWGVLSRYLVLGKPVEVNSDPHSHSGSVDQ